MTQYLNRIRIDTKTQDAIPASGRKTEITDLESGMPIEYITRIDITISGWEPAIATLTLAHLGEWHETEDGGSHRDITMEHAHCPDVDLAPLVALVEQVNCGKYRIDGNSWDRWPDGTLLVMFKPVTQP